MATTTNYGWVKPVVGGDGDAWGGELNTDLDGIDSTVKSVSNVANAALPKAGGTVTGQLNLSSSSPLLNLTGPSGSYRALQGQTNGLQRWVMSLGTGDAETGSNVGSDFKFDTFDDSGNYLSTPLMINRRFGYATFGGSVFAAHDPAQALEVTTKQYVDGGRLGDNRIINGDMRIAQRGTGGTATFVYTVDRWSYNGTQASKMTWAQGTNIPASTGFQYYLGVSSSSAYTPVAADTFYFAQPIEADMINDFAFGTSSAQPVTLSFWTASSLGGTFTGALSNDASTRAYCFTYALVANTWTKVVINIPGDTSGAWTLKGNGAGAILRFDLGSGANYRGSANVWSSGNLVGATGSVNVVATNGAIFNFTGVKLEIGSIATPYPRQSLTKSLADCQRYFITAAPAGAGGWINAAAQNLQIPVCYPVTMRATPSLTFTAGGASANTTSPGNVSPNNVGFSMLVTGTAAGYTYWNGTYTANAEL